MRPAFTWPSAIAIITASASPIRVFHFGLTPDKVFFKTEAIVDAVVDSFQGAAACITALPGGTAMRRRDEDTPVLLRDVDADNASIVARINLSCGVALGLALALAVQAKNRRRTAIFQGVPIGFETLKG